jgi:hypothetical protein
MVGAVLITAAALVLGGCGGGSPEKIRAQLEKLQAEALALTGSSDAGDVIKVAKLTAEAAKLMAELEKAQAQAAEKPAKAVKSGGGKSKVTQEDLYGTWTIDFEKKSEESRLQILLNASTITSISSGYDQDSRSSEIFSWQEHTNDDEKTKNDFPNGFVITLKNTNSGKIEPVDVYISKNKKQLVIPLLADRLGDIGKPLLFTKQ